MQDTLKRAEDIDGEGYAKLTEKGEEFLDALDKYDRMYSSIDPDRILRAVKKRKSKL